MSVLTAFDRQMMSRALELAAKGRETCTPNPRVGCVLVSRSGEVIGEGFHAYAGHAHAEVNALADAYNRGRAVDGACAYVTLEPCNHHGRTPPCSQALKKANIQRVVVAVVDPHLQVNGGGIAELRDAGIEVVVGCLEHEARWLNRGFFKRMLTGRPYVIAKLAMSVDGKIALANGQSQWITGSQSRQHVHSQRAQMCAILTGADTIIADDPLLNVRLATSIQRQPALYITDSKHRVSPTARIFAVENRPVQLVLSQPRSDLADPYQLIIPNHNDERVDLTRLLEALGAEQHNYLWLEAGGQLTSAMLTYGLVDELLIYTAPVILGGDARSAFGPLGLIDMREVYQFEVKERLVLGKDYLQRLVLSGDQCEQRNSHPS